MLRTNELFKIVDIQLLFILFWFFYAKFSMGYNGRSCVLRALCESSQFFRNKSTNMVEELIRTIFTLSSIKILPFEHPDLTVYAKAHQNGKEANIDDHCAAVYSDCGISIIALALGEYATPSNFM